MEGSISPRAIGRRRDRNYRIERTNERTCREIRARMRVLAERRETKEGRGSTNWRDFFCAAFAGPVRSTRLHVIHALMGNGARVIQNLTSDKVGGEIRGQVRGPRKVLAAFEGKVRSITIL